MFLHIHEPIKGPFSDLTSTPSTEECQHTEMTPEQKREKRERLKQLASEIISPEEARRMDEEKAEYLAPALELLRENGWKVVPVEKENRISTAEVVKSLFEQKKMKGTDLSTYKKRFPKIIDRFPYIPSSRDEVFEFLGEFDGETGRYRQTYFDYLNMIFRHAVAFFGLVRNPLEGVERPVIDHKPVRTLSLDEVETIYKAPETITEKAALEILLGYGWRQIEARRITAGDVKKANNATIQVWGKERNELTPILPETLELLMELTVGLTDNESILRSTRIRNGGTVGLGEDGMSQLLDRLFSRSGIEYQGHDLRRTFAQIAVDGDCDEFVVERLLRHKIPGTGNRYFRYPMSKLVRALSIYSPIRIATTPVKIEQDFNPPPSPPDR